MVVTRAEVASRRPPARVPPTPSDRAPDLIDLLWVALIIFGFLALLVPGFVFLAWFALVAPACEIEDRGIRDSFRRSRELVRGHFWIVLLLVVGSLLAEELLTSLAGSVSLWGPARASPASGSSVLTGLLVSPL